MPAVEDVGRQAARLTADLEGERPGAMGRLELVVRGRDLERGRLVAGVGLERQVLEPERLVDREVGQPREVVADLVRERAAGRVAERVVLVGAEALDLRDVVELLLVVLVLVLVVVLVVLVGHASALPTTACASSMIRARWSSPRKLSA